MTVGQLIRKIRISKGITQAELARRTDMDPGSLARIEKGRIPNPRWKTVVRLLKGIGASVGDLDQFTALAPQDTQQEERVSG